MPQPPPALKFYAGPGEQPRSRAGTLPQPGNTLDTREVAGSNTIDRQLVSPSDPGLEHSGAIATLLPALVSIGTGISSSWVCPVSRSKYSIQVLVSLCTLST